MATIIPFPKKEYELIERREYYIEKMTYAVCEAAFHLNIDLEEHQEDLADLYESISNLINVHLGIYENNGEGFGPCDEEVQESF